MISRIIVGRQGTATAEVLEGARIHGGLNMPKSLPSAHRPLSAFFSADISTVSAAIVHMACLHRFSLWTIVLATKLC